ncbi:MAG: riboflavin biosynthesis protein RibF [Clostridia bacterium]|nr:riboflavin biosynthesis protein RibF [Clostridia bacterium]
MKIYKLPECSEVLSLPEGCALCLGNFDGVHRGHKKLFDSARELVLEKSCAYSAVFAFTTLAKPVFSVPFITDMQTKLALFCECGLDYAAFEDFDALKDMTPEEFVSDTLEKGLSAKAVLCGFNYRFGKDGAGDANTLSSLLSERGITSRVIAPVEHEGTVISSTQIRKHITEGRLEEAQILMGHPFSICFPVIHGKQLGRTIGIPTINQVFPEGHIIPSCGIYACSCFVDGEIYLATANVGVRPTVENDGGVNCETHIINYNGDLYSKEIRVEFYCKLREEMKFDSLEALRRQIKIDISATLEYFAEKYGD